MREKDRKRSRSHYLFCHWLCAQFPQTEIFILIRGSTILKSFPTCKFHLPTWIASAMCSACTCTVGTIGCISRCNGGSEAGRVSIGLAHIERVPTCDLGATWCSGGSVTRESWLRNKPGILSFFVCGRVRRSDFYVHLLHPRASTWITNLLGWLWFPLWWSWYYVCTYVHSIIKRDNGTSLNSIMCRLTNG